MGIRSSYPSLVSLVLPLLLTFILPTALNAQDEAAIIYGKVSDSESGDKLKGVTVRVMNDGSEEGSMTTGGRGKYEMELDFGQDYIIEFEKNGYVSKKLNINTENVPEQDQELGGFEMNVDMSLFKEVEDVDVSLLEDPVGRAEFNDEGGAIDFSNSYTQQKMQEMKQLEKKVERKREELEDQEENYKDAMEDGNDALSSEDYEDAVSSFEKAHNIFPDREEAEEKLKEARELKKEAEKGSEYEELMAEADDAFDDEELEDAKKKYQEASDLLPEKDRPKERIDEIEQIIQERKEKKENYEKLIAEGDEEFDQENYEKAKGKYEEALEIFSDKEHPQDRVDEIEKILEEQEEKQENYDQLITEADEQFDQENYENAKGKYEEALEIFSDKEHPQDRVDEIDKILEGQEKKQENYDQLITEADEQFDQENYEDAKGKYEEALEIFSDKNHPQDRVDEIDKILEDREEEQEKYEQLISDADGLYNNEKFEEAKSKYEEALEIFSDKDHPQDRVDEIDKILEEQKEKQENYDQLIAEADEQFDQENYEDAKGKYEEALGIYSDKEHPKDRIAEIEKILEEQEEKQEKYDGLIADADEEFEQENYEDAKGKYEEALDLFSDKEHPQDRIDEIDKILQKKQSKQENYDQLITEADEQFDQENYEDAKGKYEEALGIYSDKEHPQDRIDEIDKILQEQQGKQENYDQLVAEADESFEEEDYEEAKSKYEEALKIFSDKEHPQDRISRIEELLKEREARKEKYDELVDQGDRSFDNEKYEEAIGHYEEAREFTDDTEYPDKRIEKAKGKLAEKESQKEKKARYEKVVADADEAFEKEDLETAKSKYKEALDIFPEKEHPQTRIGKIESLLSKRQAKEERFQEAVEKGDDAFDADELEKAIGHYEDALSIKEDAEHPKDRIEEAKKLLDEKMESQEEESAYQEQIDRGDRAFKRKAWNNSKEAYQKALEVKPNESYPKDRIEEIEKRLAEEEEKEKEEELEEEFRALVDEADQLYYKEEWEDARSKYEEALDLKPDEEHPKERIARIEEKLKEAEEEEEEEEEEIVSKGTGKKDDQYGDEVEKISEDEAEEMMARLREEDKQRRYEQVKKRKEKKQEKQETDRARSKREREEAERENEEQQEQVRERHQEFDEKTQEAGEDMAEYKENAREEKKERRKEAKTARKVEEKWNKRQQESKQEELEKGRELEEEEQEKTAERKEDAIDRKKDRREESKTARKVEDKWNQKQKETKQEELEKGRELEEEEQEKTAERKEDAIDRRKERSEEAETSRKVEQKWVDNKKEQQRKMQEEGEEILDEEQEELEDRKEVARRGKKRRKEDANERREEAVESNKEKKKADARMRERMELKREKANNELADKRESAKQQRKRSQDQAEAKREKAVEENEKKSFPEPKEYDEYHRNELAEEYPQGVTEETYKKGENKVIIRRIVVRENKADDYNKTVTKWNTYYFKNGRAITEDQWKRETEDLDI